MRGQMEADGLGLESQPLQQAASPGHVGSRIASGLPAPPNNPIWPLSTSSWPAWARRRIVSAAGEQTRTVGLQPIERTGPHQALQLHPAELARIDPGGEIRKIRERRAAARRDHRFHRRDADLLHRRERVADRQPPILHPLDGEVRRQNG